VGPAQLLLAAAALVGIGIAVGVVLGRTTEGPSTAPAPSPAPVTPPATTSPMPKPPAPKPAARTTVAVYLVRGEKLAPARRAVAATAAPARAAVLALLAGPTSAERSAGLRSEVPAETALRGVTIAKGVATVDLSKSFESGGGSVSMQLRVAQVVYTLTQFPSVSTVRFELDGKPMRAIGGEGVMVEPSVGRSAWEAQTPAILVESPLPGETVSSPIRVRGTANVFEATFVVKVEDAAGTTLATKVVTATSGTGTRGTFDDAISLAGAAPGPVTLVAYEQSAKDGSPINVVRVPLTLRAAG
jgi:germination protein M